MIRIVLLICSLILPWCSAQAVLFSSDKPALNNQTKFATVDQAFSFDFQQVNSQQSESQQAGIELRLNWQIRPGYYLYRQQIEITPMRAVLGSIILPEGVVHKDEFFGAVQIYQKKLQIIVPVQQVDAQATIKVSYQGCADAGFCYPPETKVIPLNTLKTSSSNAAPVTITPPLSLGHSQPQQLPFSPLWALLIGIGIAFTPCVLPMYPLIPSLILGRGKAHSHRRVFVLTFVYIQGMALAYTALGLMVAAAGLQFQAALQNSYVLLFLSVIFIMLALSMFGVYSLQLPSALQTRLTLWSNTQQGGSLPGVLVMGALAGLICSPCTTAPLSAILLYIAQSGNLWVGGGTLYLYALGMGIPLIVVTVFGNRLLPRSGPWMQYVKEAFGFVILALPVFLLERVIGEEEISGRLWSALGIAFFGWAFILSLKSQRGTVRVAQLLLLAATLIVARPLQDWFFAAPSANAEQQTLSFQRIDNLTQLDAALKQAQGKRVMLDFYADWCIACKEFEKYTFKDAAVRAELADTILLQADVTRNTSEQAALLNKLQVFGLPTILFFGPDGKELAQSRVTGFMRAKEFTLHLQKAHP